MTKIDDDPEVKEALQVYMERHNTRARMKKFLKSLYEFLDSDCGETLDELKEQLEEDGIDFEKALSDLKERLNKKI